MGGRDSKSQYINIYTYNCIHKDYTICDYISKFICIFSKETFREKVWERLRIYTCAFQKRMRHHWSRCNQNPV